MTPGAQSSIVEEKSLADPGEGLGPLILGPNWGRKGQKNFLATPPPLSQGLYDLTPPLICRSGSATAIRFLQASILKMDTSQRRWPPWVSATGRCTLEIWEALAAVCFTVLCLCLREKATLMTGPSKLKGSSGGGGGVIYDFFGVERVTWPVALYLYQTKCVCNFAILLFLDFTPKLPALSQAI